MDFAMTTRPARQHRQAYNRIRLSAAGLALCAVGLLCVSGGARADEKFDSDVALCNSGKSPQPKDVCLREATAAQAERRRGNLTQESPETKAENAARRCDRLPESQRENCRAMMAGEGNTTTEGSVSGGGVLRQKEIEVPKGTPGSTPPSGTRPQ